MAEDGSRTDPRRQRPGGSGLGALEGHISRFAELLDNPIPMMFIDSPLPHHQRLNYAVIGDTAGENPDVVPQITSPQPFQIGMVKAEPGNGPAYHTHDYVECFVPLTDHPWRFYWGPDAETVSHETLIGKWDLIILPPRLWRGFEVDPSAEGSAWLFAVLEPHDAFAFKDPYWAPYVITAAERLGYRADDSGKMVQRGSDAEALEQEILARIGSWL